VGIGTVLADNPRLTVRLAAGRDPQPVILDSRLRFPLDAVLLRRPGPLPWIATTPQASPQRQAALESAGGRVLRLPAGPDGQVDLNALLACLAGEGIVSLMVEGGAAVISSFLKARLVDRLALTIAPVLVGGQRALETPLFPDSPHNPRSAGGLPRLAEMQTLPMGADLVILGKLA
jgi:3,4-dihydroxy 2-butanone 4-phosphate synthase/GTP cyclohydrolase II